MMFAHLLLLAAAPALSPPQEPPAPKAEVAWFEGSWKDLLAEARKSDRVVFLDFWADW